jgi:hypothetical protein
VVYASQRIYATGYHHLPLAAKHLKK